ncbi:MAG TPA: tRNA preQ1(34) S-adenosylmethionine ribosyltransferase-isomerase QueA [Terriglobia bacterium]|nr:tRNA preQ1(34) S-adenosylmethionine ribosyltransferase-isomerase QueA [Terriglobia bacterium]
MLLEEFDYELPKELIAQRPLEERDASRMMLLDRAGHSFTDCAFRSLPEILKPGDVLVVNNTRVFPARLLGRRRGTQAQAIGKNNPTAHGYLTAEVELLLTRNESGDVWQGLVHPGRKIRTGEVLVFGGGELEAEVLGRGKYGVRKVLLRAREGSVASAIDRLGHVPLPPYVARPDEVADRETYQTVYAKVRGAVAAPTAGFHFTRRVFDALRERKVETVEITLHVGPGTFRPVQTEPVEDHRMESEQFEISAAAAAGINKALAEGRRVIAVGTTSVRTLETVALRNEGKVIPCRGETDLFIVPGFRFQVIRGLLTNFHLPKSTLLMLVSAFAGRELITRAYHHAVDERYRFYSYGDCMLIL